MMISDDLARESLIIYVAHQLRGETDFADYVGTLCTTADDMIEGRPVPPERLKQFEDFCAAIAEEASLRTSSAGCIANETDEHVWLRPRSSPR